MSSPIIGVSSYGIKSQIPTWSSVDSAVVPNTYTEAVIKSGGIPIVIPSYDEITERGDNFFKQLDGIIIIGGTDISSELYSESKHVKANNPDFLRDSMEISLIKYALQSNTPILGICRGMQLINVVQGGTLYQHLPEVSNYDNTHIVKNKNFSYHNVNFIENTMTKALLGGSLTVPSGHHQGIKEVGNDLIVTGIDDQGLVEAFEHKNHKFCMGVQWHPEEDYKNNKKVFDSLIEHACKIKMIINSN